MSFAVRSTRLALRTRLSTTALRTHRRPHLRFESTLPSVSPATKQTVGSGLAGGIAGGLAVLAAGYGYYYFSGIKKTVDNISGAKQYFENATKQLKDHTLQPDQTVQWLRSTATAYAGFIPGAKGIVDKAFNELDDVAREHGDELNGIIGDAHKDLKELAASGGLNADTAQKAWEVLTKHMQRIEGLAVDVGKDVLNKHPELKEKYGDKLNMLKELGEKQGGDAKKYVDETWGQITALVAGGSFDKDKIGKMIEDGLGKATGMGDDAWKMAMDKVKPYLDKSPEIKKLVEDNADKLKKGDWMGIISSLQDSAKNGDVKPLKEFVEKQMGQLQGMGDEAWTGAMARASLYLDKYPELKKLMEEKAEVLRKTDFEELMKKLRETKDSGDIKPVKEYIEKQVKRFSR